MTETLFERYKEALRAGHVAALRGRLEDAAAAYREAISITGDRAVPRTALGGVLLRLGDPQGALEAFDGALAVEPDGDASLLGRAQALVVLRRTAEAALVYDQLAGIRFEQARLSDAAEAARRALAIEPTDERRGRHARLVDELRETVGAAAAEGTAGIPAKSRPRPTCPRRPWRRRDPARIRRRAPMPMRAATWLRPRRPRRRPIRRP